MTGVLTHGSRWTRGSARIGVLVAAVCGLMCALAVTASATPTLSSSFDGTRTPAGAMAPTWLATDESTGDVWVIDGPNDVVDHFDASGAYLGQLRGSDTTAGTFDFGGVRDEIAVDNSGGPTQGSVYVVGEGQGGLGPGRLAAFDASGRFRWQVTSTYTTPDMCGVAVDASGHVWTGDDNPGAGVQQRSIADGSLLGTAYVDSDGLCELAFDSTGVTYGTRWNSKTFKYTPDITGTRSTLDSGSHNDVATDSSNDDVYTNRLTEIAVFDSAGVAQPPFGSGTLNGVTVDGAHGTIFVSNGGTNKVEAWSRGTGSPKPYVRLQAPTGISGTGATLNARVNPAGDSTTCQFEYVSDAQFQVDGYASATAAACDSAPDSGTSDVDVTRTISGLTAHTTYHYRIDATNSAGTIRSMDGTFDAVPSHRLTVVVDGSGTGSVDADSGPIAGCTSSAGTCSGDYSEGTSVRLTATPSHATIAWSGGGCPATGTSCDVTVDADKTVTVTFTQDAPSVITGAASDITLTSATLAGRVNPNGGTVDDCHIKYGPTAAYGSQVPCTPDPGSGTSLVSVTGAISGLTPNTLYHYKVVAHNAGGDGAGGDAMFRTLPQPPPTVTSGTASSISQTSVTLGGTANPNGSATACVMEWGLTSAYGTRTPVATSPGSGTTPVSVSAALSGLTPGTLYHWRLSCSNDRGTARGSDRTFTTEKAPDGGSRGPSNGPPSGGGDVTPGSLSLTAATALVTGPKAAIKVKCTGDTACHETVKLVAKVKAAKKHAHRKSHRRKAHKAAKAKSVVIGKARVSIDAGQRKTVTVRLNRTGRKLLAQSRSHKLRVTFVAGDYRHAVTLKAKPAKKHKKHKARRR